MNIKETEYITIPPKSARKFPLMPHVLIKMWKGVPTNSPSTFRYRHPTPDCTYSICSNARWGFCL